jgi:sugar-specific transcriptional regulator TrmB
MTIKSNRQKTPSFVGENETALIQELEIFGLSRNEAIVYLCLLRFGKELGGSKIALLTSIHRQYVYLTLEKLIKLGLALKVENGKRHKYKAISPRSLEKIAEQRVEKANQLAERLNQISALDHEQEFEIYVGDVQVKNFERRLLSELKEGETQYIISGSSANFLDYFGNEYALMATQAKEKKLASYYVGAPEELESLSEAHRLNPHFNFRLISGIPVGVTSTVVRLNTVTIYSLAKPALVYVIKSKVVSAEYKKYFDVLWNMARG